MTELRIGNGFFDIASKGNCQGVTYTISYFLHVMQILTAGGKHGDSTFSGFDCSVKAVAVHKDKTSSLEIVSVVA